MSRRTEWRIFWGCIFCVAGGILGPNTGFLLEVIILAPYWFLMLDKTENIGRADTDTAKSDTAPPPQR